MVTDQGLKLKLFLLCVYYLTLWLNENVIEIKGSHSVLVIQGLHLKGKNTPASWLVYGTFNAAAARHSDAEWSSRWPEEGHSSRITRPQLCSNCIFFCKKQKQKPNTLPWRIFPLLIVFSCRKLLLSLQTERIAAITASWMIGAQQQHHIVWNASPRSSFPIYTNRLSTHGLIPVLTVSSGKAFPLFI